MHHLATRLTAAIFTFIIGVAAATIGIALRSRASGEIEPLSLSQALIPAPQVESAISSVPDSPIRRIDFGNFTYSSAVLGKKDGFKLRLGEHPCRRTDFGRPVDGFCLGLGSVDYDDLTGDGQEDAIVNLDWETGGTATPSLVYIYTLKHNRTKLLWAFETGDRADGGYKGVYANDGELVIELYGKNKVIGTDLYADDETQRGDCCPTFFTRTRYEWRGNRFQRKGEPEVFPLDR